MQSWCCSYSKQQEHHMTWEAKGFLHIGKKMGFSLFYFIYIWVGLFILSRINLRYFILTQRKIKKWRGGSKSKREEGKIKEGKRGSFVWNGYYLPKNISSEILNYRFFSFRWESKWLVLWDLWILHSLLVDDIQWVADTCMPEKQSSFSFLYLNNRYT